MFFYNLGIYFYYFLARLASFFNPKAKKMLKGQKETFSILSKKVDQNAPYIWVHVSSLGEFEQGRPIIEYIKKHYPQYKILLSFFSPSGYEVQKNYPLADIVCYLPMDTKKNVKKFLSQIKPEKVVFVKYEFWYHYTNQLKKIGAEVFVISAKFREKQIFFKWYGGVMRKLLSLYTCICVQDEKSQILLKNIGINNTKVTGDTRFDRVLKIKEEPFKNELIDLFVENRRDGQQEFILVCGSTWPKDDDITIPYFNNHLQIRTIIVPHELSDSHLNYIESQLTRPSIRYSKASQKLIQNYDCLIIDQIGLLASLYRYATIAYVGGGFGIGIHNVLEPAVYGIPVIFGPNFKKFKEAQDLIAAGGAYSLKDAKGFNALMDELIAYPISRETSGERAKEYVQSNAGSINKVMDVIMDHP